MENLPPDFAEFVMDIHGMDVNSPPPLPTLVYDSRSQVGLDFQQYLGTFCEVMKKHFMDVLNETCFISYSIITADEYAEALNHLDLQSGHCYKLKENYRAPHGN